MSSTQRKEGSPAPTTIVERLLQMEPDKNLAWVAIGHLKDQREIAQFMGEYAAWLSNSDDPECQENPFRAASINVSYFLSHEGGNTQKLWASTIEGLANPWTGVPL